jgi:hypothetical protein
MMHNSFLEKNKLKKAYNDMRCNRNTVQSDAFNPIMTPAEYETIECWCKAIVAEQPQPSFFFDPELFQRILEVKSEEHGFPFEALQSLLRNIHLNQVKVSTPKVKRNVRSILEEYKSGASIKDISRIAGYPPFLMARYILLEITNGICKKSLTKLMRNPNLITNDTLSKDFHHFDVTRLASEVKEAIDFDPLYGPSHDRQRHFVGVEFEVALERQLFSMGK